MTESPLGYEVHFEQVTGCGADFQLRSLLNRQQYYDPLKLAELAGVSAEAWPLFGVLWPSGRVLAHAMLTYRMHGQRILEVGCGLGLASLVLQRREQDIRASDCHPLVPEFLNENTALNAMHTMAYTAAHWARPNPTLGKFDLIIGSDLLYDHGQPEALSRFIDAHTEADGRVVLADPNRRHRTRFSRQMEDFGFGLTWEGIELCPGLDEVYRGRLLTYRRSSNLD